MKERRDDDDDIYFILYPFKLTFIYSGNKNVIKIKYEVKEVEEE